ncbi:hypothetical protein [Methanimicrococcus stummii]|nr:hypothetical protein [Methanimicrococcus sp. Es2]
MQRRPGAGIISSIFVLTAGAADRGDPRGTADDPRRYRAVRAPA